MFILMAIIIFIICIRLITIITDSSNDTNTYCYYYHYYHYYYETRRIAISLLEAAEPSEVTVGLAGKGMSGNPKETEGP